MKERLTYIDNLRGLCLTLMILGHAGLNLAEKNLIYSFHMPAFYFLAGLLYHGTQPDAARFLGRKARALLLPYALYVLLIFLVSRSLVGWNAGCWVHLRGAFLYGLGIRYGGGALWFLPSLFWTYALIVAAGRLRSPAWLTALLCLGGAWAAGHYGWRLWFGFTFTGPFFFLAGHLYARPAERLQQAVRSAAWRRALAAVLFLAVYALLMYAAGYPGRTVFNIAYMPGNPPMLLAALTAVAGLLLLFRLWRAPAWWTRLAAYASRHALTLIGCHFVPIVLSKELHWFTGWERWPRILALMGIEAAWLALTCAVVGRWLPPLEGRLPGWLARRVSK